MSGRPLVVTGAAGFVGTNLVRHLVDEGHDVVAVVRSGGTPPTPPLAAAQVRTVELLDPGAVRDLVDQVRPRAVVHLATLRDTDDPAGVVGLGARTTMALVRAAAAAGVDRIVHAGSSTEYGAAPTPYDEDGPRRPRSWYGAARAAASDLFLDAHDDGVVEVAVLRLFHVYGAWEPPQRLVPRALRASVDGDALALTPRGAAHDLVHVDDVVAALTAALDAPLVAGRATNVCTGVATDNHDVVAAVERVTGRPVPVARTTFPSRAWDRPDWVGRPGRIAELLGRDPLPLDDGLRRTAAWWDARGPVTRAWP